MAAKLSSQHKNNKVFLHVGPHKTGTTAIQVALARSQDISYPSIKESGPGHALYAWRTLGMRGYSPEPNLLCNLVVGYNEKSFPIVLSSEAFCHAVMPYANSDGIVNLANEFEIELIVTLTPLAERVMSQMQELIKHKQIIDLENEQSVHEILKGRPGLRPDFLEALFELAPWHKVHVILVDKKNPSHLFCSFSDILHAPIKYETDYINYANGRLLFGHVAFLNVLNKLVPNSSQSDLIAASLAASRKVIEIIPDFALVPYPPLSQETETRLNEVWSEQMELIRDWEKMGKAKVY